MAISFRTPLVLVVVLSVAASNGFGQFADKVADTPHNLRKATQGSMANLGIRDYGDVCVYCHLQHELNSSLQTQLWNRVLPTTLYLMYDSPIMARKVAGSPDSTSLVCLSCHDGSIPLDAVKKVPTTHIESGASNVTISSCSNTCHTASNPSGGISFEGGNMGSDLRNHHPIGIRYDAAKNPDLHRPSGGKVNGLPLYGPNSTQVGCGSCHEPHDNSRRPFLRISNNDAALCLACHDM
ncbi:MAG: cytochrome c3 family protein [bacterium]